MTRPVRIRIELTLDLGYVPTGEEIAAVEKLVTKAVAEAAGEAPRDLSLGAWWADGAADEGVS